MNRPELTEHIELCAAVAAGSLDSADRQKYAEHLADGCDECDEALPNYERATVLLAASLPLSAPAPGVRDRVLEVASGSAPSPMIVTFPAGANAVSAPKHARKQAREPAFEFRTPPGTGAAVSGVFVFVALASVAMAWHYRGESKKLHDDIASGTEVITALNQQLEDSKVWGDLYTQSDIRTVRLDSTPRADAVLRARGIYDSRSQHAEFVFSDLRPAAGKVYQLWAMQGSNFASLGLIKPDENGRAVVRIKNAGDPNRLTDFGVSLENAGGSGTGSGPTGPVVMTGRIQG